MEQTPTFHLLHAPQGVLEGRQGAGLPLGLPVCREVDLQLLQRFDELFVGVGFGGLLAAAELKKDVITLSAAFTVPLAQLPTGVRGRCSLRVLGGHTGCRGAPASYETKTACRHALRPS